jgi:hypothetical protein
MSEIARLNFSAWWQFSTAAGIDNERNDNKFGGDNCVSGNFKVSKMYNNQPSMCIFCVHQAATDR